MHPNVFHNDRLLPLENVRLSPGQVGLLSGWGLFTTLRIYDGHPFAFERHWNRLTFDAARIQLPFPFERERLRDQLYELLEANRVVEGAARIYFVLNRAGHWSSNESFPDMDLIMYSAELPSYPDAVHLTLRAHGRDTGWPLTGTKVTSWLGNVWSLEQARRAGFDEVILLNERGEVAECTAANLFCVRAGKVATPPLASGCLAGVTRAVLLEISGRAGIEIQERVLKPDDLSAAEEVFLSSTTREILPVRKIEQHTVPSIAGTITTQLEKTFAGYVREYIAGCRQRRQQSVSLHGPGRGPRT